jgi:predicted metal-dependent enzyme (double-stranded beta helix superfamily)
MFEPEEFVARCRLAVTEPDPAIAVKDLMAETVSRPENVSAALAALGTKRPGQNTWLQSPTLTVQCIVWPNGVITPPHEHRMWAVIGICQGQEDNTLWRRTSDGVETTGGRELKPGDVIALGPRAIHAVANPCRYPTVGIHVYGGDILNTPRSEWDYNGRTEHDFDQTAVDAAIAGMIARSRQLGRDLDFDEVREACLARYRQPSVQPAR